jgi:hypothetical protein
LGKNPDPEGNIHPVVFFEKKIDENEFRKEIHGDESFWN